MEFRWQYQDVVPVKVPDELWHAFIQFLEEYSRRYGALERCEEVVYEGKPAFLMHFRLSPEIALDALIQQHPDGLLVMYAVHPPEAIKRVNLARYTSDLTNITHHFVSTKGITSLYLVFLPETSPVPASIESGWRRFIGYLLMSNMFYFFIFILVLGVFIYRFFFYYTPLILVAMQVAVLLLSDRLAALRGDFKVDAHNQIVYLAELQLKQQDFVELMERCWPKIMEIKQKIYDRTLGLGKELVPDAILSAFSEYGVRCTPHRVLIKKINLYKMVADLAQKFRVPIPKIALVNVLAPNAAATGVSPSRATLLVTSGLLTLLEEEEINGVLAHEFSHVKARDPVVLFAMTASEYLIRVYFLWWLFFLLPLFFAYFMTALTLLFFIAKFLEARADLDAAYATGNPMALARALRKAAASRLQMEMAYGVGVGEWLTWDTHPPIYFRVRRLEKLDVTRRVNTFTQSVKDVISGLLASIKGVPYP